jgi:hypothetical protein
MRVREWYRRHKDEPDFIARRRRNAKKWYARHKNDPEYKKKVNEIRLKLRDSEHFRAKAAEIVARYRYDPLQRPKMDALRAKWVKNNPEKIAAYNILHNALRRGDIIRPESCTKCGVNPGRGRDGRSLLHAHHRDHLKPLEVEWLCCVCHGKEHRRV